MRRGARTRCWDSPAASGPGPRGEEEDQGEEIVLSRRELHRLEPWFEGWRIETFHLLSMAKRLMRGRLKQRSARAALALLENTDRAMIGAVPPLRWWCGEALIIARRSKSRGGGQSCKCQTCMISLSLALAS